MVGEGHRLVATPAVNHIQVGELRHGERSARQPIDDNFTTRVNGADGGDRATDQRGMILTGQTEFSGARRFIDEIKTEEVTRDVLVATSEGFPQEYEGILRDLIPPKIMLLQVIPIRTEAWGAMDVQAQLNAA